MRLSNWLWLGCILLVYTFIGSILTIAHTEFAITSANHFKIWAAVAIVAFTLPGFSALAGFLLVAGIFSIGGALVLAMTMISGQFKNTQIAALIVVWLGFVLLPLAGNHLWKTYIQSQTIALLAGVSWLGLGLGWLLTRVFK
jgi:hypothetical protein